MPRPYLNRRLGGPPPGFSPAVLSGLALWLPSTAGTFQDDARTTPADEDLELVGGWTDRSPAGRHATNATTAQKPVWKPNVQAGKPGLLFDNSDDRLNVTSFVGTSHVLAVVCRPNTLAGSNVPFGSGSTTYGLDLSAAALAYAVGGTTVSVAYAPANNTPALYVVERVGTTVRFRVNGVQIGADQTMAANTSITLNTIGSSGAFALFGGHLFEIVWVDGVLLPGLLAELEHYLRRQWSL